MTMESKCKICGVPLDLDIDPEYDAVADPNRLIPMATCNRCYDMRTKRENYHDDFNHQCADLLILGKSEKATEQKRKVGLVILCRKYAKLICQYSRSSLTIPVDELVDKIMDNPKNWIEELRIFRRQVRAAVREERDRQPALVPHND